MSGKFKPLAGQVIVIMGAGSGLGLEVAKLAAKGGAAVILSAGDEGSVRTACEEIGKAGGRCHPVAADPGSADGCDRVARAAAARFGRIDSWIDVGGAEATIAHAAKALAEHLGDRDPWTELMPAPQALPADLVGEGAEIPTPRVAAMHEGKRRKRAERQAES